MKRIVVAGVLLAILGGVTGCVVQHPRPSISEIGTAKHHVTSGMMLLEKGKIPDAMWQFDRAIDLDPYMATGYIGRAMAYLMSNDLKRCWANLEYARSIAEGDEDWINLYIGNMRLNTAQKQEGWLEAVEREFKRALDIDPRYKATYFYMGVAYKEAFDFKAAERMFEQVMEINDPFLIRADREWKLVRKVLGARPASHIAKAVSLQSHLTRAQLASLLVKEVGLESLLHYRSREPQTEKSSPYGKVQDIQNHLLKADIETVLRLNMDDLTLMPDKLFHPDELVSRSLLAEVIEDLMKYTDDDSSRWTMKVTASPFRDVAVTDPRFRAILYCVTRGFMSVNDISTDEFSPDLPVTGSDTVVALRKIRDHLQYR